MPCLILCCLLLSVVMHVDTGGSAFGAERVSVPACFADDTGRGGAGIVTDSAPRRTNTYHAGHGTHIDSAPAYQVVEDKLGASLIKIVVPEHWNKDVLILAHGLMAASWPLSAEFSPDDTITKALIAEGWMIAKTSYRRNGWIMATNDVEELRQHIIETYGLPNRVFLEGGSMGAAIVTRLVETHPGEYAGALAIGQVNGPYTYDPKMPLLLLSNQNEAGMPKRYLSRTAAAKDRPAFWVVKRNGHCNTTSAEELKAFRALVRWTETGEIARDADGTLVEPPPASVAVFADGAATAKILRCASSGGSCDTEFTAADLVTLGIPLRSTLQVSCNGKTVTVLYGVTYSDVPKGGWVAFIRAEGSRLRIARNYADAVAVLECKVGDSISIAPVTPGVRPSAP